MTMVVALGRAPQLEARIPAHAARPKTGPSCRLTPIPAVDATNREALGRAPELLLDCEVCGAPGAAATKGESAVDLWTLYCGLVSLGVDVWLNPTNTFTTRAKSKRSPRWNTSGC